MTINKHERFKNIAEKRVQKLLDGLRLLGNCSNTNNYEYTEQEVQKMFAELSKALKDCKALYDTQLNKSSKSGFKF